MGIIISHVCVQTVHCAHVLLSCYRLYSKPVRLALIADGALKRAWWDFLRLPCELLAEAGVQLGTP